MSLYKINSAELRSQFNIRSTHHRQAMREIINTGNLPRINEDVEYEVALAIQDNIEAEDDLIYHFLN